MSVVAHDAECECSKWRGAFQSWTLIHGTGILRYPQEFIVQHHHDHGHSVTEAPSPVVEVDIRSAYNGTEYAGFEQDLHQLPGVTGARLDRTRGVAHLSYDPAI